MGFDIRRLGTGDKAGRPRAGRLIDRAPRSDATRRFLAELTHHLLIAYDAGGEPIGSVCTYARSGAAGDAGPPDR